MKAILAGVIAVTALTAFATSANAFPHHHRMKVCSMHHHHRVCTWR